MPHIFPKRFLRTRDLLTPEGLNSDIHPSYDALSGKLDRTNFDHTLKGDTRPHPDDPDGPLDRPSISEGAYYKIHTSQIESKYRFYSIRTSDDYTRQPTRRPPNFVALDGATTRYTHLGADLNDAPPSVVPNNGAWTAVQNGDLTGSQKLTFTTGQSKIWVSAYLQYIWQGFYEFKSPYITGAREFRGMVDLDIPDDGETWERPDGTITNSLAFNEAAVLNMLGPASIHEHLADATTENIDGNLEESSAEYAFPLNEASIRKERATPGLCGSHHISQGHYPSLVQFALRIDGKIIEETITGKKYQFEESTHGLKVTDSVRLKEDDEDDASDESALREFLPFFTTDNTVFGQRSANVSSAYGDSDDCRPGQKVKSSRAVSCGPEVMPVRLGAVISVEPGTHTIELVARRLQRKKGKFIVGDFVGVFSRRMLAFDLPINTKENDTNSWQTGASSLVNGGGSVPDVPAFKSEDKLTNRNINLSRKSLAGTINSISEHNLDTNVLTHEQLPSKVTFHRSVTITPELVVNPVSGEYGDSGGLCFSDGVFAGFTNPRIDSELSEPDDGWYRDIDSMGTWLTSNRAGWYPIQISPGSSTSSSDDGNILKIKPADTPAQLNGTLLRPGEIIIVMMDVEVRRIEPLNSPEADTIYGSIDLMSDGDAIKKDWCNFGNWLLTERYLDLFALFAIGYKVDGSYIIGSGATPALVNSFSWVNRGVFFNSGPKAAIPFRAASSRTQEPWDFSPGWGSFSSVERRKIFENTYINTPRLASRGGNLMGSNMGITVPIMQVIENTTGTDQVIDEFGGYVSTMVPSHWTSGHSPDNNRLIGPSGGRYTLPGHWCSPVGSRKILAGCRVHFGNSRLTVIKTWK